MQFCYSANSILNQYFVILYNKNLNSMILGFGEGKLFSKSFLPPLLNPHLNPHLNPQKNSKKLLTNTGECGKIIAQGRRTLRSHRAAEASIGTIRAIGTK